MNLVDQIEAKEMKKEVADVHIGDTVKVHMRIVEGEKERIQVIEGVVIKMRGGGSVSYTHLTLPTTPYV